MTAVRRLIGWMRRCTSTAIGTTNPRITTERAPLSNSGTRVTAPETSSRAPLAPLRGPADDCEVDQPGARAGGEQRQLVAIPGERGLPRLEQLLQSGVPNQIGGDRERDQQEGGKGIEGAAASRQRAVLQAPEQPLSPADRDDVPDHADRRRRAGEDQQGIDHRLHPRTVQWQEIVWRKAIDTYLRQVCASQREPGQDHEDYPEREQAYPAPPLEQKQRPRGDR